MGIFGISSAVRNVTKAVNSINESTVANTNTITQSETNTAEFIKMKNFTEWIKGLAVYLGRWPCSKGYGRGEVFEASSIDQYDNVFIKENPGGVFYIEYDACFICVAGYNGKSQNPYVKETIECIFPGADASGQFKKTPYNTTTTTITNKIWRDDLPLPNSSNNLNLIHPSNDTNRIFFDYNIFWNLFLLALDDDIYNAQLSNVIELANYWKFTEPMLRDWCRAVEYVMNGNQLSEDCDLQCETVEGRRFFLHKNE